MAQEFQVIILAGGTGSRLSPLTDGGQCKSMLPVANRPLISYQLEILEKAGFTDAIVLTTTEYKPTILKYTSEVREKGNLQLSFETIKGQVGTIEALLRIKDKIKTNFIVVSGDLIVGESFIHHMADVHRTRDAALTMLLKKQAPLTEEEKAATKKNKTQTNDIIGLDDSGRVLYFTAAADLENSFNIRKSLLRTNTNMTIHTNLLDSHLFIFSHWVLDLIDRKQNDVYHFQSIKGELIPYLILLQRTKKVPTKNGTLERFVKSEPSMVTGMSSKQMSEPDKMGCFAIVMSETDTCIRVNTLDTYIMANQKVASGTSGFLPEEEIPGKGNFISPLAIIGGKAGVVGVNCVVGASTTVGGENKSMIKNSVIGRHCKIGNGVKITNSVIMDYVTIQDNCTISNSVLCNNVFVGEGSSVKDSQAGKNYNFETKSNVVGESLETEEDFMSAKNQ